MKYIKKKQKVDFNVNIDIIILPWVYILIKFSGILNKYYFDNILSFTFNNLSISYEMHYVFVNLINRKSIFAKINSPSGYPDI